MFEVYLEIQPEDKDYQLLNKKSHQNNRNT